MASPMRKKRAWSTREDDAESQETAAFEATVAAAKDTAAKSGAFLSSAKSDLTDHQRWLRAQSAAVERDRQRHERWLQRQQEHRLAQAKKERVRRRRQLMRQQAMLATRQAIVAGLVFIRSWIVFAFAKIGAGFKYVGVSIAGGFAAIGRAIAAGFAYAGHQIAAGARWTGATLSIAAHQTGKGLSAGAAWGGGKVNASAKAGGTALAASSAAIASKTGRLSRSAGRSLGSGLSTAGAKGSALAGATGRTASRGFSHLAAKASALGAASKRGLARGYGWTRVRAAAIPPAVYVRMAKFGRQAEHFARTRAAGAQRVPAQDVLITPPPPAASVHVLEVYGPHKGGAELFGRPANDPWTPEAAAADERQKVAEVYGPFFEGFWVEGTSPNEPRTDQAEAPSVAARADGESALSSWAHQASARAAVLGTQARLTAGRAGAGIRAQTVRAGAWVGAQPWGGAQTWAKRDAWAGAKARAENWARTRDFDLSQMMIIAGAVLLVCGGLLVGGGLLMRAGARTPAVADVVPEETFSGITWTFNEADLPLPERAVFTLSGTPESFRINGLSVSGVNNSDQPLTGLVGVLKPDVQRPDLRLALKVDKPQAPVAAPEGQAEGQAPEPQAMAVLPKDAVPAHTPFRLVFPFPPEAMGGEDGITVDEFFDSYGGLLLKLRYEIDGVEKSVIQYLSPDMLKTQLDEVAAEAGGS
jgi:hypothetical protein